MGGKVNLLPQSDAASTKARASAVRTIATPRLIELNQSPTIFYKKDSFF
jgi:hypothetical protein